MIVDVEWAWNVAKDLLEGVLPRRWSHVQGVQARASIAARMFDSDGASLLLSAAVLHDIGYAPAVTVTGFHPLDGARFLRTLGASESLCALVAHHSCAYREAELRGLSSELAEWTDEEGPLRDSLWWADMTTTPDGGVTNALDRIEEIQKRYGPEDLVTFFIRQATPEILSAVERTEARLQAAGIDYTAK